jgi:hypothetical protein
VPVFLRYIDENKRNHIHAPAVCYNERRLRFVRDLWPSFLLYFFTHNDRLTLAPCVRMRKPFSLSLMAAYSSTRLVQPKVPISFDIWQTIIGTIQTKHTEKLAPLLCTPTPTFGALRIFNFAANGSSLTWFEIHFRY